MKAYDENAERSLLELAANRMEDEAVELARRLGLRGDLVFDDESSGFSAAHWASRFSLLGLLDVLAENGANFDVPGKHGMTPLMHHGSIEAARRLLAHGATPYAEDAYGNTAFDVVLRTEDEEYVDEFRAALDNPGKWRALMEASAISLSDPSSPDERRRLKI